MDNNSTNKKVICIDVGPLQFIFLTFSYTRFSQKLSFIISRVERSILLYMERYKEKHLCFIDIKKAWFLKNVIILDKVSTNTCN